MTCRKHKAHRKPFETYEKLKTKEWFPSCPHAPPSVGFPAAGSETEFSFIVARVRFELRLEVVTFASSRPVPIIYAVI